MGVPSSTVARASQEAAYLYHGGEREWGVIGRDPAFCHSGARGAGVRRI